MSPSPSRVPLFAASILLSAALAVPPAASGQPTPITLDPFRPVAIAADGQRVAWIRDLGGGAQALVTRESPTSAEQIVVPRLRMSVRRLALGTDSGGRPTVVLATGGAVDPEYAASRPQTGALYAARLDGRGGVRKLAASHPGGPEVAPGLRRGVLSFARVERVDGLSKMTLRVGSLTRSTSRVLWDGSVDRPIVATAVGAERRVVFTTHASPGEINVWNLRVARPGHTTRSLERLPSGFNSNAGYGPVTLDAPGTRATVSRWLSDGDGGVLSTHDLQTTRRVGTLSLDEREIGVPVAGLGVAAYQTNIFATCQTPRSTATRDACPLTFLPR